MPTVAILFCDRCGSETADVAAVKGSTLREYRTRSYECSGESAVDGFTAARADAPEQTLKGARSRPRRPADAAAPTQGRGPRGPGRACYIYIDIVRCDLPSAAPIPTVCFRPALRAGPRKEER